MHDASPIAGATGAVIMAPQSPSELLFLGKRTALRNKPTEFVVLLSDTVRSPLLILSAGRSSRLFDELSNIIPQNRDTIIKLCER
jgi:hypothetical protein